MLETLVVLAQGGWGQNLGNVRELSTAALRADDDFAVRQILLIAQFVIRNAASGGVARIVAGQRMNNGRTDVAGFCSLNDRLGTARIAKRGFAAQLTGFREVESFSMTKISH